MSDPIVTSLAGEEMYLEDNPLAVVTGNWIVVRPVEGRARAMIAVHRLTHVESIKVTHPALITIGCGLGVIAAAAYYSKDGASVAIPAAILSVLFVAAFIGTRRAFVLFRVRGEEFQTGHGSMRDASAVVAAVRAARRKLYGNG